MAEEAWQGREEEMVEEAATSIFQKIVRCGTGYCAIPSVKFHFIVRMTDLKGYSCLFRSSGVVPVKQSPL